MELPNQELMESWDKILELDNQIAKLKKDNHVLRDQILQIRHQVQVLFNLVHE
jgi:hypothetical protein